MKKKTLNLKGLKTPKLFLFIHGFTNGRMKTGFVAMLCERYTKYASLPMAG